MKTPGAGTPRVNVRDAGTFAMPRLVRVSANDNVEPSGGGIKIELLDIV